MKYPMFTVGLIAPLLLMGCTQTTELSKTKKDLLLTKVKLAVLSQFKSEDTFQDPLDNNKFVFVTRTENQPEATESVAVYDATKDTDYASTGNVSLDPTTTFKYIYNEYLPNTATSGMTFYVAGMDGSKLIIWETGADNSPGPCSSMWVDDNGKGSTDLTAIDINTEKPVRTSYVVPQSQVDAAIKDQKQCAKGMGISN